MVRFKALLLVLLPSFVLFAGLQSQAQDNSTLTLVLPSGKGAIPIHLTDGLEPRGLMLKDGGERIIATFKRGDVNVSYILDGISNHPLSSIECRNDTISAIVERMGTSIKQRKDAEMVGASGQKLATTEYVLEVPEQKSAFFPNLFGFTSFAATCAEIHVSQIGLHAFDLAPLRALITSFAVDAAYQPTFNDYMRVGSVLFKMEPASAVPYYRSALETVPHDGNENLWRRLATDQLVMSLGMSGDLKESRRIAESAANADPEYPMNDYMLACADAESGSAESAKAHLQRAWEHRANVLPGEKFPDPSADDSLLKLKKNKEFWTYVLSISQKP